MRVLVRVGTKDARNARRVDEEIGVGVLGEGGADRVGGLCGCYPAHYADIAVSDGFARFLVGFCRCGHDRLAECGDQQSGVEACDADS